MSTDISALQQLPALTVEPTGLEELGLRPCSGQTCGGYTCGGWTCWITEW
jgi:hypothetical protein